MNEEYVRMAQAMVEAREKHIVYCDAVEEYTEAQREFNAYYIKHQNKRLVKTWYNRLLGWYWQKKSDRLWAKATLLYNIMLVRHAEWKIANDNIQQG
jgi:hypothetical protein